MENTLSNALRSAVIDILDADGLTIADVSNYNIGRAAATGIFTIIFYKNTKTEKGDKKTVKLKLDSSTSTLVTALDVIDAMVKENSNKSFLSSIQEKNKNKKKTW